MYNIVEWAQESYKTFLFKDDITCYPCMMQVLLCLCPLPVITAIFEWSWHSDHQSKEREVAGSEGKRGMEHPHGPRRGGDHLTDQGRRRQPAEVAAEEDNAGAQPRQVQPLRQPRDARGELDGDEQTHGPGAEEQEADDLVSSEAEQESAENTAEEARENQNEGAESAGEKHSTKPAS